MAGAGGIKFLPRTAFAGVIPAMKLRRLDQLLSSGGYCSRSEARSWLKAGRVRVGDSVPKSTDVKVDPGVVRVDGDPLDAPDGLLALYHKPPGCVCSHDTREGRTIYDLLPERWRHRNPVVTSVGRLDRDTTGLLVVARTLAAQTALVAALQRRDVHREYRAVVNGVPVSGATVDRPIGRHPRDRQRMAVLESGGREAVTHYRVLERFRAHACLAVQLETGRTHQIRVHLSEAGFPVTGDPDYGGRVRLPKQAAPGLVDALRAFRRQALHAFRLSFVHPGSGEVVGFEAPVPEDMQGLLAELRADREEFLHGG